MLALALPCSRGAGPCAPACEWLACPSAKLRCWHLPPRSCGALAAAVACFPRAGEVLSSAPSQYARIRACAAAIAAAPDGFAVATGVPCCAHGSANSIGGAASREVLRSGPSQYPDSATAAVAAAPDGFALGRPLPILLTNTTDDYLLFIPILHSSKPRESSANSSSSFGGLLPPHLSGADSSSSGAAPLIAPMTRRISRL